MWKLHLSLLFVFLVNTDILAQQKSFDQPIQLQRCNISVNANPFVATTTMELEFYNPQNKEVEGYQSFELDRGQVVTGFQLELNGKYREGSIEEKWKANNAYNSIVGKRIDPAILNMDYGGNYSLRIYPIAAHGTRKVIITIKQLMKDEKDKITYYLPLHFTSTTNDFSLDIHVENIKQNAITEKGLLEGMSFINDPGTSTLNMNTKDIKLNKAIAFFIPVASGTFLQCISKDGNDAKLLMKTLPAIDDKTDTNINTMSVYWDVSLSATERNIERELDFLEQYIKINSIKKVLIVLFNQKIKGTITYLPAETKFNPLRKKLEEYDYSGSTELGNLDLYNDRSDAVLIFSDGKNSIGNSMPRTGAVSVSCVISSANASMNTLQKIIGTSGGKLIDLTNDKLTTAINKTEKKENFLMRFHANTQGVILDQSFPVKLDNIIFLSGTALQTDALSLEYGNNSKLVKTESILVNDKGSCDDDVYKDLTLLKAYDSMLRVPYRYNYWAEWVVFGLKNKVVTPQTSFLVLEKIEHYIQYKIAPPKELEEKCAEMNYVYKSEYKIQQLKTFTEQEQLQRVVNNYNLRIKWWNKEEKLISLLEQPADVSTELNDVKNTNKSTASSSAKLTLAELTPGDNSLKEVIVTGAFGTKRSARSTTTNVQIVNQEQLNTVRQTDINNALAGKVAGIQVRSNSSAILGRETMVRLRGENSIGIGKAPLYVLDGAIMPNASDINIDDVEDVAVLQGPAAAALFGPDAANGAIVVTSKKARRSGYSYYAWNADYKLDNQQDVEYIEEIKSIPNVDIWDTYKEMQKTYRNNVGFYFDMASYFYGHNKYEQAEEVLYDGIEICNNNVKGLKAAAYVFESWKRFDLALDIYKKMNAENPDDLSIQKDMALAYFQKGDFQKAVDTYYNIVTKQNDNCACGSVKDRALVEMNAIIEIYKGSIDISKINKNLIKALPVDMRIVVESNGSVVSNFQVIEPDAVACNIRNPETKNGGHLVRQYDLGNNYYSNYNYYYYYNSYYYDYYATFNEYMIKDAKKGTYKIKVNAYDYYGGIDHMPTYLRVIVFKNFNTTDQSLRVQNVIVDNQYGTVEIASVNW